MSMLKRQRELRKAEKAALKRAKRHGIRDERPPEPAPTVELGAILGNGEPAEGDAPQEPPREDDEPRTEEEKE